MENLASESTISINVVLPVCRFGHKHRGPDKQNGPAAALALGFVGPRRG